MDRPMSATVAHRTPGRLVNLERGALALSAGDHSHRECAGTLVLYVLLWLVHALPRQSDAEWLVHRGALRARDWAMVSSFG
jgi:hypothetical protein